LTLVAYARYVSSVERRVPGMPSARCEVRSASDGARRVSVVQRSMSGVRCSMFNPWYCLALFLFMLGLMSKPMLVTLPFVLLLLDYWPLRRFELSTLNSRPSTVWRLLLEKLPFFTLSIASSLVTLFAQRSAMTSFESFPLPARLGTALLSCKGYLAQMICP